MASDDHDSGGEAEASHGPQECMPCRGTGKVISNLGGKASKITCPWCEGDGTRKPEIDAQTRWSSGEGAATATEPGAERELAERRRVIGETFGSMPDLPYPDRSDWDRGYG